MCIGQEAVAVSVCAALKKDDYLVSSVIKNTDKIVKAVMKRCSEKMKQR